jgi:hypothetical protein
MGTRERSRWRHVIVGTVFDTRDAVAGLVAEVRRRTADRTASALDAVHGKVHELSDRGVIEEERLTARVLGRATVQRQDATAEPP